MKFRLLAALLFAPLAARAAYPDMTTLKPHGGQIGADVKLTIAGARLDDFEDLMFYTPGFKVKSVESRAANKVELTLSIDKSVRAGNHVMRVRTKSGVSHMRQFFASPFPNVEEKEPNSDFASAQPIALNQTVEGVILSEDVDYFKLTVKKGQRIGVQVDGLRLAAIPQGAMDPYVAILDKDKFEKAFSDDTILHRQDGYCSFTAEYDGDYYVMVRESSYRGSANSFYRLHVGDFRRPDAIYPAGGKLGSKLTGNLFRLSTIDNTLEAEPNDTTEKGTLAVAADAYALNGIIEKPGDVDCFRIPLKKGQVFECRALAQILGSPLDPVVNVYTPKGASLVGNDDGGGMRRLDSRFKFTAAVDGVYTVRIADHLERGGANFVYRIEMVASQPSLTFASPDYTVNDTNYRQFMAVPKGGRMVLLENFTRNGVGGDYRFELKDLPAGVKLLEDAAPGDQPGVPLVLEAAADAPYGGAIVTPLLQPKDPNNKIVGQMRRTYDIVRIGNVQRVRLPAERQRQRRYQAVEVRGAGRGRRRQGQGVQRLAVRRGLDGIPVRRRQRHPAHRDGDRHARPDDHQLRGPASVRRRGRGHARRRARHHPHRADQGDQGHQGAPLHRGDRREVARRQDREHVRPGRHPGRQGRRHAPHRPRFDPAPRPGPQGRARAGRQGRDSRRRQGRR
ncbi:MAG: hypothetical protein EBV31_07795, partial [Verrucomicrobia bacterium]|nr:hypothetical protein [Verrucomicrobiota bacterium]